ncbi:hypothetical protein ARMSODRAFT_838645, partial [Armillaria solidipes]
YVIDIDGTPVGEDVVEEMQAYARAIWYQLLHLGIAPGSWSEAVVNALNLYEFHMCRRFPLLSLCESTWKAFQICTDNYSSWFSK